MSLMLAFELNILVDDALRAVIVDFGLAVYTNAYSTEFVSCRDGNVRWRPPEAVKASGARAVSARATPEMDVWSFAHVCMEVRLVTWFTLNIHLGFVDLHESESIPSQAKREPSHRALDKQ